LRRLRKIIKYSFWIVLGLITVGALYGWVLYRGIRNLAVEDHACGRCDRDSGRSPVQQPPSPVLKARLDHALDLYNAATCMP
jgi:hypothetical protein